MNKILLITTKNCEGCEIAKRQIKEAISQTTKDVYLEVKDYNELHKRFLSSNGIADFPAILIYNSRQELKIKKIGSVPAIVMLHWIKLHCD